MNLYLDIISCISTILSNIIYAKSMNIDTFKLHSFDFFLCLKAFSNYSDQINPEGETMKYTPSSFFSN